MIVELTDDERKFLTKLIVSEKKEVDEKYKKRMELTRAARGEGVIAYWPEYPYERNGLLNRLYRKLEGEYYFETFD